MLLHHNDNTLKNSGLKVITKSAKFKKMSCFLIYPFWDNANTYRKEFFPYTKRSKVMNFITYYSMTYYDNTITYQISILINFHY